MVSSRPGKRKTAAIILFGAVIVLLWVVFYILTVRVIRSNMEKHAMNAVGTIMNDIGNEMLLMEESASILSDDAEMIAAVNAKSLNEFYDINAYAQEMFEPVLKRIVNADSVVIYNSSGDYYRLKGTAPNTVLARSFYLIGEGSDNVIAVSSGRENYIGIYEEISDEEKCVGYVLLLMDQRKVEKLLSVYNDPDYIGAALYYEDKLVCAGGGIGKEDLESRLNRSVYVTERYIGLTGCRIVVYCVDSVSEEVSRFFRIALPVTILILVFVGFVFERFMKRFVKTSVDLELERTNLTLLKKQISAHFTVNTLNIVRALIGRGDKETASRICTELSIMLRYANAADEYISLLEEFYVLEQYTEIMQARYPDMIEVQFDEDDSFSDIYLPRMLIQPIVENAIMHGLSAEGGKLEVNAHTEKDDLFITVSDNGKGMDAEGLENVRNAMEEKETSGQGGLDHIALVNVRKRIEALFGKEYGLEITSDPQKGTEVTVHLPVVRKDDLPAGNEAVK